MECAGKKSHCRRGQNRDGAGRSSYSEEERFLLRAASPHPRGGGKSLELERKSRPYDGIKDVHPLGGGVRAAGQCSRLHRTGEVGRSLFPAARPPPPSG